MTKPDHTQREYRYEGPNDAHNLTAVIDEEGITQAEFAYDAEDRAIRSAHIGGTDAVTIDYNDNLSRQVTDGRNNTTTFTLAARYGIGRVTSSTGSGCSTCPFSSGKRITYSDDNYLPETVTDARNITTRRTYDSRGNRLSTTEAEGMAEERITTFTWHADRNLPLTITRPGASGAPATNKFTYDSNGNLLKLQENFGTPLVRTTRFTWNSHGQMMSIDGPRTDVADTASFAWLPASSGGFLSTVTNGKGHVTQFENYNAFGKPGKITDTNNIVTTFTSMS